MVGMNMTFVDKDALCPPKSLVMLVTLESNCSLKLEEADRIAGQIMLGVFQVTHDMPGNASEQGRYESIKSHFLQLVEGDSLLPHFSWAVYLLVLGFIEDFTSHDATIETGSIINRTEPFITACEKPAES